MKNMKHAQKKSSARQITMKTSTKFIASVSHDNWRTIFSVVKGSLREYLCKHFNSFSKGCFSLITRDYNLLRRTKNVTFLHLIWSGVLLLWRYFCGTNSRDFLCSSRPRNVISMKPYFFWRPRKLIEAKIFKNLFISSNFIPVLTKKMSIFVNKSEIQFKGIKS